MQEIVLGVQKQVWLGGKSDLGTVQEIEIWPCGQMVYF